MTPWACGSMRNKSHARGLAVLCLHIELLRLVLV